MDWLNGQVIDKIIIIGSEFKKEIHAKGKNSYVGYLNQESVENLQSELLVGHN